MAVSAPVVSLAALGFALNGLFTLVTGLSASDVACDQPLALWLAVTGVLQLLLSAFLGAPVASLFGTKSW